MSDDIESSSKWSLCVVVPHHAKVVGVPGGQPVWNRFMGK